MTADRVLLAAGVIGTTKIVLRSAGDTTSRLPLLENPAVQIPFVRPAATGQALDERCFGLTQLNLIWESSPWAAEGVAQGSFLEITSPMRAEFFGRFPLSARANLALIRQMLPAMLVMQLYFPASIQPPASLSLQEDGRLRIDGHRNAVELRKLGPLLQALRSLGLWTHRALISTVEMGHAIHYAGTLPVRESPGRYETWANGRLAGSQHVFIADSATFPRLPAKNMSFAMMANAMRVADSSVRE